MSEEIQIALLKTGHVKISKIDEIALRAAMDAGFKNSDINAKII